MALTPEMVNAVTAFNELAGLLRDTNEQLAIGDDPVTADDWTRLAALLRAGADLCDLLRHGVVVDAVVTGSSDQHLP